MAQSVGRSVEEFPIRQDFSLATGLSLAVAVVMAGVSAVGLLSPTVFYPTDELVGAFVPNDIINLAAGLPILLGTMWLARRGKLIGLLLWPGALFYVLYAYVPYVLAVPLGPLFLPYLVVLPLSAGALISLIISIDGEGVRKRIDWRLLARVSGGILLFLAAVIVVRQIALVVGALVDQRVVAPLEYAVWISDFTIAVPVLLVVGIQLLRRKALGYVCGAGLFFSYGILALALIPVILFQAARGGPAVGVVDIIVLLGMAALTLIPCVLFMRRAAT